MSISTSMKACATGAQSLFATYTPSELGLTV